MKRSYWTHGHNLRYEADKRLDRLSLAFVHRMPRRMRMWAVVDAAVRARKPQQANGGYCGPDGLTYKDLHDATAL